MNVNISYDKRLSHFDLTVALIVKVLGGELLPYFDPVEQEVHFFQPEILKDTPLVADGMKPVTLEQAKAYCFWTNEEVREAKAKQAKIESGWRHA